MVGVPNVFATQSGSVPASELDANFNAIAGCSVVGAVRNLVCNVAAASATATWTADEIVVQIALGGNGVKLNNVSDTINLATNGIGGMDTGTAPVSGYVSIYKAFNPTTKATGSFACNVTTSSGSTYSGANAPSGYTETALISTWPTNGSGQFVVGFQQDRHIQTGLMTFLTTATTQASLTSISVASEVPPNAKTVDVLASLSSFSSATIMGWSVAVQGNNLLGNGPISGAGSNNNNASAKFYAVGMPTAQTIYYLWSVNTGTASITLQTFGYTF